MLVVYTYFLLVGIYYTAWYLRISTIHRLDTRVKIKTYKQ